MERYFRVILNNPLTSDCEYYKQFKNGVIAMWAGSMFGWVKLPDIGAGCREEITEEELWAELKLDLFSW